MLKHSLTTILAVLACVACTDTRTSTTPPACFDYDREIQPVLDRACLECHGPTATDGDYSVATRAETFARRPTDGAARIEARADALFLLAARGREDHPVAQPADLALLERWLVECQSSTFRTQASHPRGWLDADSPEFHGAALQASAWDFDACADCHGAPDDPGGGSSGLPCVACHVDGPTDCSTCHGRPATGGAPAPALDGSIETSARGVGAHRVHATGQQLAPQVECEDCHRVPASWDEAGHILTGTGEVDPLPAEVIFSDAASRSLEGLEDRRAAPPSYDATTGTCNNVYCHAAVLGDTTVRAPVWTEITEDPACDACHGLPPSTHAEGTVAADCTVCHPLVAGAEVDARRIELIDESLHGDGRLSLGDGSETCSACHGSSANSAPPAGVNGETATSEPQVGAHQAHVVAGQFRGPLACADCHPAPAGETFIDAVIAEGHVDTLLPAEVFPPSAGGIAFADGATPSYARPTCANTYCHGGGTLHAADTAAGIVRAPDWTDVGNDTIVCGACHGLPPARPGHPQELLPGVPITRTTCAACHPLTIDAAGEIIFRPGGWTTHIDGEVTR